MTQLKCFESENADSLKFVAEDGRQWYGSLSMGRIMFGENYANELADGLIDAHVTPSDPDTIKEVEEKAAGDWTEVALDHAGQDES